MRPGAGLCIECESLCPALPAASASHLQAPMLSLVICTLM